jgi:hypothetical protein
MSGPRSPTGSATVRLLAIRAGLVCLGFLLPVLVLELGLRLLGPVLPGDYQTAMFNVSSPFFGVRNNPDTAGWARGPDYVTWVQVNSKGLRGPEVDYAKPADTYRILVLGDSFTFAQQVPEQQTFAVQLGERLREARPDRRVETINAGTNSWSTAHEYAWLASEGYQYQPDLVLLMFYVGNDPGGNARWVGSPEHAEQLQLAVDQTVPARELRTALSGVSVAWNVIERGVLAKLQPPSEAERREGLDAQDQLGLDPEQDYSSINDDTKVRGWLITEALLARLRDLTAEHGARLVVVGIPAYGVVVDAERRVSPLPVICESVGLPLIDLLDPFRGHPRRQRKRFYLENDYHWTAAGHAEAASIVAAELLQLGLESRPDG